MDKLRECPFCSGEANTTVFRGITGLICGRCGAVVSFKHREEHEQAISAWNTRVEEPNEPLTLDELKQMDGEPVWCIDVPSGCYTGWHIIILRKPYQNEDKTQIIQPLESGSHYHRISNYGKTWLAYKHKPKEDD